MAFKAKKHSVAGTALDPTIEFASLVLEDIPSEYDDGVWRLVWNHNNIAWAERQTGQNFLFGFTGLLNNTANFSDYRCMLFACLRMAHPKITVEVAGGLIGRFDMLDEIRKAIAESWALSMPEKKRAAVYDALVEAGLKERLTPNVGETTGQTPGSTSDSQTTSSGEAPPAS